MNIEMEKQLTDLKNKFSDLKKENKDLVKNLETSESEKRFQKELYQERLEAKSDKNFNLRQELIKLNYKEDAVKKIEKKPVKKYTCLAMVLVAGLAQQKM